MNGKGDMTIEEYMVRFHSGSYPHGEPDMKHITKVWQDFANGGELQHHGAAFIQFFSRKNPLKYANVCHANLSRSSGERCTFLVTGLHRTQYVQRNLKFYDFLLNRSVFKHAFLAHSVEDGFAVCRTDIPSNYMASAAISLRLPWEHPYVCSSFLAYTKMGLTEDEAFALSMSYRYSTSSSCMNSTAPQGHSPARGGMEATTYNLANRLIVSENANDSYYNSTLYSGIFKFWSGDCNTYLYSTLGARVRDTLEGVTPSDSPLNLFKESIEKYFLKVRSRDSRPLQNFKEVEVPTFLSTYKEWVK